MRLLGLEIRRANVVARAVPDTKDTLERLNRLEIDMRAIQDELSALEGRHLKLRKQFDGSKGGRPSGLQDDDGAVPRGDKAGLRVYARQRGFNLTS